MVDENAAPKSPVRVKVRDGVTIYAGGGSHGFEAGSETELPADHVAELEKKHVERLPAAD